MQSFPFNRRWFLRSYESGSTSISWRKRISSSGESVVTIRYFPFLKKCFVSRNMVAILPCYFSDKSFTQACIHENKFSSLHRSRFIFSRVKMWPLCWGAPSVLPGRDILASVCMLLLLNLLGIVTVCKCSIDDSCRKLLLSGPSRESAEAEITDYTNVKHSWVLLVQSSSLQDKGLDY